MSAAPASLSVWVNDNTVCVKIVGRATFNCSVDFKALIQGLWDRGARRFQLDLTNCVLMDSTFLGVLAGFGMRTGAPASPETVLELLNPNARIADLLDNLGVAQFFKVIHCPPPPMEKMAAVERPSTSPDRREISRTCLEAHQTLMSVNPENVAKFKDVARFLAEDLQRSSETDSQP
jgi:anti-anti-sigma regulatory factor